MRSVNKAINYLAFGIRIRLGANLWLHGLLTLLILCVIGQGSAQADESMRRGHALIVGVATYEDAAPVQSALNDARAIDRFLKSVGFQTILVEDGSREQIRESIQEFSRKLRDGGIGLFYFAGHAVQHARDYLLLPSDSKLSFLVDEGVQQAIPFADILSIMATPRPDKSNVIIIDACRDYLLPPPPHPAASPPKAMQGLEQTMVVHAATIGARAAEGDLGYGLLTASLLQALSVPGIGLQEAATEARGRVSQLTKGAQTPTVSSTLSGDLALNPPAHLRFAFADLNQNVRRSEMIQYRAISRQLTEAERERVFWETIMNSKNRADFETFLRLFPDGAYADDAREQLNKLAEPQSTTQGLETPRALEERRAPQSTPAPRSFETEQLNEERLALSDVNVRAGPDNAYPPVATTPAGSNLTVLGKTKTGWFQVRTPSGEEGFVYGSLLSDAVSLERAPSLPLTANTENQEERSIKIERGSMGSPPPAPVTELEEPPAGSESTDPTEAILELRAAASPDSFQIRNLEQFAADVRRATRGALTFSITPDPKPFASRAIRAAIAQGEVALGAVMLSEIDEMGSIFEIDALPFLVANYFDAKRLWDTSRSVIEPTLLDEGVRLIFVVPSPPHGLLVNRIIFSSEDLNGIRLFSDSRIGQRFAEVSGATPVPPSNRSLSDLVKSKQVDAIVSSMTESIEDDVLEEAEFYYYFPIALPKIAVIANANFLQQLSEESRIAVFNLAVKARNRGWNMSVAEENQKFDMLSQRGVKLLEPTPELVNALLISAREETITWARLAGSEAGNILNLYRGPASNMHQ